MIQHQSNSLIADLQDVDSVNVGQLSAHDHRGCSLIPVFVGNRSKCAAKVVKTITRRASANTETLERKDNSFIAFGEFSIRESLASLRPYMSIASNTILGTWNGEEIASQVAGAYRTHFIRADSEIQSEQDAGPHVIASIPKQSPNLIRGVWLATILGSVTSNLQLLNGWYVGRFNLASVPHIAPPDEVAQVNDMLLASTRTDMGNGRDERLNDSQVDRTNSQFTTAHTQELNHCLLVIADGLVMKFGAFLFIHVDIRGIIHGDSVDGFLAIFFRDLGKVLLKVTAGISSSWTLLCRNNPFGNAVDALVPAPTAAGKSITIAGHFEAPVMRTVTQGIKSSINQSNMQIVIGFLIRSAEVRSLPVAFSGFTGYSASNPLFSCARKTERTPKTSKTHNSLSALKTAYPLGARYAQPP